MRVKTGLAAIALAVIGLGRVAFADAAFECSLSAGSQVEVGDCVNAADAAVTQAIDAAVEIARTSAADLDATTGRPEAVPALEAAQVAWVAYRDAQCTYVGSTWGGGSGTGIAMQSCRVELGRARVAQLMALVN